MIMDNCCFNRPFDDQGRIRIRLEAEAKLFIQKKVISNDLEIMRWNYDDRNGNQIKRISSLIEFPGCCSGRAIHITNNSGTIRLHRMAKNTLA